MKPILTLVILRRGRVEDHYPVAPVDATFPDLSLLSLQPVELLVHFVKRKILDNHFFVEKRREPEIWTICHIYRLVLSISHKELDLVTCTNSSWKTSAY